MKQYVVGFAMTDYDGDWVLLLNKQRPAWQKGRLNGPGGHIEDGESPVQAMEREFREEVGVQQTGWEHFATLAGVADGEPFEVFFFVYRTAVARSTIYQKARHVGFAYDDPKYNAEREEPEWVQRSRLPAKTLPNLHWLLPMAASETKQDWPYLVVERATREEAE